MLRRRVPRARPASTPHRRRAATAAAATAALLLPLAPAVALAPAVGAAARIPVAQRHLVSVGSAHAASVPASRAQVRRYKVDLVLVRTPAGRRDRTTLADLRAAVRRVDAFYDRNTAGRIRFAVGRTHRWTSSSTACSIGVPRRLAARLGWTSSARRLVVAYQPTSCDFVGVAELPGHHVLLARSSGTTTMAHEIGHTLGLGHSNLSRCTLAFSHRCTRAVDARRSVEYGDATDLMGGTETAGARRRFGASSVSGTLNPRQLRALDLPVPHTSLSLTSSRPVSVTLRARVDRSGWSAATLRWGGRTFWLSYLAGTGVDDPLAGSAYATRPFHGQVVVQTRRGAGSLLVPVSRGAGSGAGMPDWTLTALPNGRTLQVRTLGLTAVLTVTPPDPARPAWVVAAPAHSSLAVTWSRPAIAGVTGYIVEAHAGSTVVTRTVPATVGSTTIAVPRAGQPYRVRVYPLRGTLRGTPGQAARSVASWPALGDIPASTRAELVPGDPARWRVVLEPPPDGWGAVRSATVVARDLGRPGSFDLETGTTTFGTVAVVLDQAETGPGPYRVTYVLAYRDGGTYTALVDPSYVAPA